MSQLAARAKQSGLVKVAVLAFIAMCAQDILATGMVIAEAHYNALIAGLFDVTGYIAGLICAALALDEIIRNGWRTRRSLTIIGSVSVANFVGTVIGVAMGQALSH